MLGGGLYIIARGRRRGRVPEYRGRRGSERDLFISFGIRAHEGEKGKERRPRDAKKRDG